MSRNVTIRTLVVLCTGILFPVVVSAQGTSVKSAPPRNAAEQLEAIAFQPKAQFGDWIETGEALEQAARLRPNNDAQAVTDLFAAAGSYQMGGNISRARWAAQDAAKRALKVGNVYQAAVAHIAAAKFAIQLGDPVAAQFNLEHARQLADSPRLTGDEMRSLFKQMGYPVDQFCRK